MVRKLLRKRDVHKTIAVTRCFLDMLQQHYVLLILFLTNPMDLDPEQDST